MATKKPDFSVILPTYTGLETISGTLQSLLSQKTSKALSYEIIVIIDGPHKKLKEVVESHQKTFIKRGIPFKIKQFEVNRGRFEARLYGAEIASSDQLLFLDDRVTVPVDYLSMLVKLNHPIIMPNAVESLSADTSFVPKTLHLIRRKVYGKRWGRDFEDHYIDKTNFEQSPKGTTSFWVDRTVFMKACQNFSKVKIQNEQKYVNEDTGVMRQMIEGGNKIFRSSKLQIVYNSRTGLRESLKHIYDRGPRFVDYYSKPGTRFFPVLGAIYIVLLSALVLAVVKPSWLIGLLVALLICLILAASYLSNSLNDFISSIIGLGFIAAAFTGGVIKGSFLYVKFRLRR